MLRAIADKLASQGADTTTMNPLTASMALMGLQGMASNCVEVRQVPCHSPYKPTLSRHTLLTHNL